MRSAGHLKLLQFTCLASAFLLAGCGTQFSDPILQRPAPSGGAEAGGSGREPDGPASVVCDAEPVQTFGGAAFATLMRTVHDDFTIELWLKPDQ